jgi:hypothetical protein
VREAVLNSKFFETAVLPMLGKFPTWLIAAVVVMASLAVAFAGAVVWDMAGRVTTVRTEKGVEIKLSPRALQDKR